MSRDTTSTNAPQPDRLKTIRNGLLAMIVLLLIAILTSLVLLPRKLPPSSDISTGTAATIIVAAESQPTIDDVQTDSAVSATQMDPADVPINPANEPPPLIPGVHLPHLPTNLFAGEGSAPTSPFGPPRGKVRIPISPADEAAILAEDAKIPREQIATGPTAAVSLFGSPTAVGRSFVFVIDRSASMGGGELGAIQAAAKEFASQLNPLTSEQTFQVVAYNQAADYLTQRELVPATSDNKRELVNFVTNLAAFGQTEHLRGLRAALRLKPEVIFLLTDGGDPVLNPAQLRDVRDENAGRAAIHCLHFGRGPQDQPQNFLVRLAAENRGSYLYVDMNPR